MKISMLVFFVAWQRSQANVYEGEGVYHNTLYLYKYSWYCPLQITGLFNIRSLKAEYPNYREGIVLLEAMRFGASKARRLFGMETAYYIIDSMDSPPPFFRYTYPVISALYSWQVSNYLEFQHQRKKFYPFMNVAAWGTESSLNLSKAFLIKKFMDRSTQWTVVNNYRTNFYATVPSEYTEVKIIIELLIKLNFTYVSVVGSNDPETRNTVQRFVETSRNQGICSKTQWISKNPGEIESRTVLHELKKDERAKVVVLFTSYRESMSLMKIRKYAERLTFVSGSKSGLQTKSRELSSLQSVATGLLILQQADTYDAEFADYFMSLKLQPSSYTWFKEFWSHVFNCSMPASYKTRYMWDVNVTRARECTGDENLTRDIVDLKYFLVKPVLNAVESIACAVWRSFSDTFCAFNNVYRPYRCTLWYKASTDFYRRTFGHLKMPNCTLNNTVKFNDDGYYERGFIILNFNGTGYNEIGHSNYSRESVSLSLSVRNIAWKGGIVPNSTCYRKCKKDEVEYRGCSGTACCYTCIKCGSLHFIRNNTCVQCPAYQLPAESRRACKMLPKVCIDNNKLYMSVLLVGTVVGLLLGTCVVALGIRHKESRVVKAASRELSLVMVMSLYVCFSSNFLFLLRPTQILCGTLRLMTSTSLSAFYAPLLLKTVRLYRIFTSSKKSVKRPALVSPKSQILLSLLLVSIFLAYGIVLLILEKPGVEMKMDSGMSHVAVFCQFRPRSFILAFLPNLLFMVACTYYAYKMRDFPSNFNESFSMRVTMYCSCFLWAVFIPLLFLFQYKPDSPFATTSVVAGTFLALTFVHLIGIFFPLAWKVMVHSKSDKQVTPSTIQNNTVIMSAMGTIHQAMQYPPAPDDVVSFRDVGTDPIAFAEIS